ncbi:NAD(P)-binding protein [Tothia fuscella]|uniref:NAD(P)-binding protein n=1 Tax=Tothia fuscella TaxID=1048955 RepID=A0A9P4TXR3_9PEZI|nr:NAD(P)-binding protein [Tothia fuscella]
MSSKVFLITGATGKQGGAVIDALLKDANHANSTILAVTRNVDSPSSKNLSSKSPTIKLIQGNLDDVPAIFAKAAEVVKQQPIWGVYSVQISQGKGVTYDGEIKQGKALIDESVKNGVAHFVYGSIDRGGEEESWENRTPVLHFGTKFVVERYLRENAGVGVGGMKWTILRPVAFMDNLEPNFQTKVFLAALSNNLSQKPLQWVATKDIGIFASKAFADPDKYNHKAIGLAGDELNVAEISATFKKVTGEDVAPTYWFLGSILTTLIGDLGAMVRWFGTDGYGVDIGKARELHPGLMGMERWIREESQFVVR